MRVHEETRPNAGLSVHVVDVTRGKPAQGMKVEVFSLVSGRVLLAEGTLAANGVLEHPIIDQLLDKGAYEVVFHAGAFFAAQGAVQSDPPFLNDVPFRFNHCRSAAAFPPADEDDALGLLALSRSLSTSGDPLREPCDPLHHQHHGDGDDDENAGDCGNRHIQLAFQILPHADGQHVGTGIAQEERDRHIVKG